MPSQIKGGFFFVLSLNFELVLKKIKLLFINYNNFICLNISGTAGNNYDFVLNKLFKKDDSFRKTCFKTIIFLLARHFFCVKMLYRRVAFMIKKLLDLNLSKEKFQERIDELHSHDIATSLMTLEIAEREQLYHFLTNEQIAEIVAYLEPETAADILEEFNLEKQREILDEMTVEDAVDILQAYQDKKLRTQVIESLSEKEDIKEFIKYGKDAVGAYMNNEFVVISPKMDVKEAVTSLIAQAPDAETINTLFVVDENKEYLGAVNLKKLVKARSPKLIEEIMTQVPTVGDKSFIAEAVYDMKNYEVFELPVIDEENQLIGILTLDDALDVAALEAEEGFHQFAALPSKDETRGPLKTALYRFPWLAVLMILSIPLISFTDLMTSAIAGIAILVFFQPLMLDSPGNVSTQTLAIALKAISNEGKMKGKDILKEISSGLITGLILGVIAFLISFLFVLVTNISPNIQLDYHKVEVALIFASILGGSLAIVVAISHLGNWNSAFIEVVKN